MGLSGNGEEEEVGLRKKLGWGGCKGLDGGWK
jgi:hypothetical protein